MKLERIRACELGVLTRSPRLVSRTERWMGAVQELRDLLGQYEEWLENLPEGIRSSGSALVEKLEAMGE
jgi:hypothetical protein